MLLSLLLLLLLYFLYRQKPSPFVGSNNSLEYEIRAGRRFYAYTIRVHDKKAVAKPRLVRKNIKTYQIYTGCNNLVFFLIYCVEFFRFSLHSETAENRRKLRPRVGFLGSFTRVITLGIFRYLVVGTYEYFVGHDSQVFVMI